MRSWPGDFWVRSVGRTQVGGSVDLTQQLDELTRAHTQQLGSWRRRVRRHLRRATARPAREGAVGSTMRLPPATSQPLRRARLGIRGYLVLYAAGLGSMLLGGAVVHAVAQPDLVRCSVCRRVGGGATGLPASLFPPGAPCRFLSSPFFSPRVTSGGAPAAIFFLFSFFFFPSGGGADAHAPLVCVLYLHWMRVPFAAAARGGGRDGFATRA